MIAHTRELIEKYREIMRKKGSSPDWAVHKLLEPEKLVTCTIPFVGKNYDSQSVRILVYASAENLSFYTFDGDITRRLDDDDASVDRHRAFFDTSTKDPDVFFPNVHLQPINNGCLATAVLYIASKLGMDTGERPCEFYEKIAFGNYCKYSIETERQRNDRIAGGLGGTEMSNANIDYAGKSSYLSESKEFIAADIGELKPDYVIMPETIYRSERDFIDGVKGDAVIIPIYQINVRVVNNHIAPAKRNSKNYPLPKELSPTIREWLGHISSIRPEKYLYVFGYLDEVMENIPHLH